MIIGISGKLGSGKDTVGDIICKYNKKFIKKSFAYKVKEISSILSGIDLSLMFTQEGKNIYLEEWGMTVGEMQQKVGTEAIRNNLHKDAWVLALFSTYKPNNDWVITDVRFRNEANAIKERGGFLIRIDGDPAKIRKNSKRNLNHQSEIDLDDYIKWDKVIVNNYSLSHLEDQVHKFFTSKKLSNMS